MYQDGYFPAFSGVRGQGSPLDFSTVVISDVHLFKKVSQAPMLVDFLRHVRVSRLIINGDFIDGWHIQKKNKCPVPEMHARVMDAVNRLAATGTEVIFIAGNHDENLRKARRTYIAERTPREGAHPILRKWHNFRDKKSGLESRIFVANSHFHVDSAGKRFLILHGDQFDPKKLKTRMGAAVSRIGDSVYDGLIRLNAMSIHISRKYIGRHFSIAAYAKRKTKETLGIIERFERAVAKSATNKKIDGIICGHIHHAEIRDIKGVTYMNSGDWVESCTALVDDARGGWRILDWAQERERLKLGGLPDESSPNPDSAYRGITMRQLRAVERIWPARDRVRILKTLRKRLGGEGGRSFRPSLPGGALPVPAAA